MPAADRASWPGYQFASQPVPQCAFLLRLVPRAAFPRRLERLVRAVDGGKRRVRPKRLTQPIRRKRGEMQPPREAVVADNARSRRAAVKGVPGAAALTGVCAPQNRRGCA